MKKQCRKGNETITAQLRVSWREGPRAEVAGNWFMGVV